MHGSIVGVILMAAAIQSQPPARPEHPPGAASATCDAAAIAPDSYRLTIEAQAFNLTKPTYRWWDTYDIGQRPKGDEDLDDAAIAIAERARELDDRNLLAHAQLARQYLIAGVDAKKAYEAWNRVLDGGAAVAWLTTLFDVDDRAFFVAAIDRKGIRVYRLGQLAGAIRMEDGIPVLPGPDREELWRALGGCFPPGLTPEATIPWSGLREIGAGNFVLWFELDSPVTINSDRGRRKRLSRLMINFHNSRADLDFRYAVAGPRRPLFVRPSAVGPAAYHERVRGTLIHLFDPAGRIKVPPPRRFGW